MGVAHCGNKRIRRIGEIAFRVSGWRANVRRILRQEARILQVCSACECRQAFPWHRTQPVIIQENHVRRRHRENELVGRLPVTEPEIRMIGIQARAGFDPVAEINRAQCRAKLVMAEPLHILTAKRVFAMQGGEAPMLTHQGSAMIPGVTHRDDDAAIREQGREQGQTRDIGVVLRRVSPAAGIGFARRAQRDDFPHVAVVEALELRIAIPY